MASNLSPLHESAGLVDFGDRTLIEVTGDDRVTFLHNMCTADVKRLEPGQGVEAFVTNVQGKVLGHVLLFVTPSSIILDTVADQADALIAHLDRYIIREDAVLADRSGDWSELLLAGPDAVKVLQSLEVELPAVWMSHVQSEIAGCRTWICNVDLAGSDSFFIRAEAKNIDTVRSAVESAGANSCDRDAFEAIRIEQGTPLYGPDITSANLPQEVDRDDRAISFTKGCYLGQETVARIDALGRVNKLLRGVRIEGDVVPEAGMELTADGKNVGSITSATFSPRLGVPLALAYIRRGHHEAGAKLDTSAGSAEVVKLPVSE